MSANAHSGFPHSHGGSAVSLLPTVDPHMPHGGPAHSHGGSAVEMITYIKSSNDTIRVDPYRLVDRRADYQSNTGL
ncbi:hypothetical protein Y032_0270g881 [Ancylostoma ceylanicum]|uniref:Uncharacterized protein n=1 Tax=Ancylostoma ceylanicum TaxID=53326 RepID=A0A016S9I2_9BILA|nr:hypothetical protein Y032_0270g881 [Ancylostoma ceylanicum]